MTELYEQTFDGKLLPRHLKMFRDMDSGRIELLKNGYRSEIVCAFWDDDSIEFALSLLKRRAG